jgi:K+-sensing histidine kinase KdpD
VNQLVETVLRDIADSMTSQGYATSYSSGPDLPPVFIDFKQLCYCLRTMLQNDISGMGEERSIEINSWFERDSVILGIEDRSRHISQAELDRLLVPFSETHDLGAGLALALCKTMLERQGIPFVAQADLREGIRYTITLPTRKEE